MRKALIKIHNQEAGILTENDQGNYSFVYFEDYKGVAISLTMPIKEKAYLFDRFPPFFDGLLPEGIQLEGLLKAKKIDRQDYFSQLIATGEDLVGAVSVHSIAEQDE